MSSRPLACLFLFVLALGCRPAGALTEVESAAVDRALDLIHQRLALMPDVAKAKWSAKKPIADPDREAQLLDAVAARAREKGMDVAFARTLVAAQVEAAKLVQQAHFDRWTKDGQGRFDKAVPLADLRRRIDDVTGELLDAGDALRPLLARERVRRAVGERAEKVLADIDAEARAAALKPLLRKEDR